MYIPHQSLSKVSLFFLVLLTSCTKREEIAVPEAEKPVINMPIPTLKRPDIILNELAKGDFHNGNITYIDTENSANVRREWRFQVGGNSNQINGLSMVSPPYLCEKTELTFKYNSSNFIDEIVSVRTNSCLEFSSKWVYKYNYEDKLLVSIIGKNYFTSSTANSVSFQMCENLFSYYPDGKVHEIYSRFGEVGINNNGYQKKTLQYDSLGNVVEVTREEHTTSNYDEKYTFEYEDKLNPLKGIYIISSIQAELPGYGYASSLGPRFLSRNCVKSIKSEYLHQTKSPRLEYFDSQVVNNRVVDFGHRTSSTDWMRYFIKY